MSDHKFTPEPGCCEHGIQLQEPSHCYRCLQAEIAKIEAISFERALEAIAAKREARSEALVEVRDALIRHSGEPIGRLGAIRILMDKIADFPAPYDSPK